MRESRIDRVGPRKVTVSTPTPVKASSTASTQTTKSSSTATTTTTTTSQSKSTNVSNPVQTSKTSTSVPTTSQTVKTDTVKISTQSQQSYNNSATAIATKVVKIETLPVPKTQETKTVAPNVDSIQISPQARQLAGNNAVKQSLPALTVTKDIPRPILFSAAEGSGSGGGTGKPGLDIINAGNKGGLDNIKTTFPELGKKDKTEVTKTEPPKVVVPAKSVVPTNTTVPAKPTVPTVTTKPVVPTKPASTPASSETSWAQAIAEGTVSTGLTEIFKASAEIGHSNSGGQLGTIASTLANILDIKYDVTPQTVQGETDFNSKKSVFQSSVESLAGSSLGSIVDRVAAAIATGSIVASSGGNNPLVVGSGTSSFISAALVGAFDTKYEISSSVGEAGTKALQAGTAAYQKEKTRINEASKKLTETLTRETPKEVSKSEQEKYNKYMKNVAEQNGKIIEAKKDWVEAQSITDPAKKKEAITDAEKKAKEAREKGGTVGNQKGDTLSKAERNQKEQNEKIEKAKDKWRGAEKIKDPVEKERVRKEANEEANRARSAGGTIA